MSTSPAPRPSIDVVFTAAMDIAPKIHDGSIVDAVELFRYADGPVALAASQFSYDTAAQKLTWTAPGTLAAGYYELRLDGLQFYACAGSLLQGGDAGLQFQIPVFDAAQVLQAGSGNLQVDSYSVPSLADWNSDQQLDLIVGEKTQAGEGKVRVYLNQGTAAAPVFGSFFRVQAGGSDLTLPGSGCLGVFPRVTDWDGDGRQDLLVGLAGGGIHVFLNTGSGNAPVFGGSTPVMVGEPGAKAAISLGARATVAMTDWNEDGRVDLVAGALDGQVRVYLNQAATGAPDFRAALLVSDGSVALDDASGRSSVAVIDLNGDGRQDLVLGNTAGEMRFFANVGTNAAPAFDGVVAIQAGGAAIDLAGTPRSRPFVGDFNADGIPDLLVGSEDGLIRLYEASAWPSPTASPGHTGLPGEPYAFRFELPALMWHNADRPLDVNGDGTVDVSDALRMLDELNHPQYHGPTGTMLAPGATGASPFYCDVNADGLVTPRDCLLVINELNAGTGEGETNADLPWCQPQFDAVAPVKSHSETGAAWLWAHWPAAESAAAGRNELVPVASPGTAVTTRDVEELRRSSLSALDEILAALFEGA